MSEHTKGTDKVVQLSKARKEKEEKSSLTMLLKNSKKVAHAIQLKTCLICHTKKMCVNLTGLCATCYESLSPQEKQVADSEAQHKHIEIKVTDDRWNNECEQ